MHYLYFRHFVSISSPASMENIIDNHKSTFDHCQNPWDENASAIDDKVLSIGAQLLELTNKIDQSLGGMVLNTFIKSLIIATFSAYAVCSVLLNDYNNDDYYRDYFMSWQYILLTILPIIRLTYYTNASQCLSTSMRKSANTLNRIVKTRKTGAKKGHIELVMEEIKEKSVSPIKPLSLFSLSNNNLIGTFATILTYLIVLISWKMSEPKQNKELEEIKEILQQLINGTSSTT